MSVVWVVDGEAPDYPPTLLNLAPSDQPKLHGVGDRDMLARLRDEPTVTIVGARRASSYGLRVAEMLAHDLSVAGVTVVSGMALGIDSAAHRGALAGGGRTVAVLAGGPERASPPSNAELHRRIAESGAVISEHAPGTRIEPFHFAHRNRIMAALAEVVVIVEAAQPSGTMVTCERALELGRTVGAVPGQIGVRVAEGANDLIKDGAPLIRDARDVLDLLFGVGAETPGSERPRKPPAPRRGPALEPELAGVLDLVGAGTTTIDGVAAAGDVDARDAAVALARLELLGYVRADALGGYEVTGLQPPQ
jgi:DNA processing protein